MEVLNRIIPAPPDPIFGINLAFAADPRPRKINASVGTYRSDALTPYLFQSVKKAEQLLFVEEPDKEYLPIAGDSTFLCAVQDLVFGDQAEHLCAVQTVGGTGALRLIAELLYHAGVHHLHIGTPTWGNHEPIFSAAALQVHSFPYFDINRHLFDHTAVSHALSHLEPGSTLLLHASCHNPTGCDPTQEQWHELLHIIQTRHLFVIFDLAYQGFGEGLLEDAYAVRLFTQAHVPCAVAVSHSKNFGLYAERVGALYVACSDPVQAQTVLSRLKVIIRRLYSNPPCHGARIVAIILQTSSLRLLWEEELERIRARILRMRHHLFYALGQQPRFAYLLKQKGMFGFMAIPPHCVESLQHDHAIYLTRDGRINLAGLNEATIEQLAHFLKDL